jgi:hypothetical protein
MVYTGWLHRSILPQPPGGVGGAAPDW